MDRTIGEFEAFTGLPTCECQEPIVILQKKRGSTNRKGMNQQSIIGIAKNKSVETVRNQLFDASQVGS